jgi:hypothetical protein
MRGFWVMVLVAMAGNAAAQQKCEQSKLAQVERTALLGNSAKLARQVMEACPSLPPRIFLELRRIAATDLEEMARRYRHTVPSTASGKSLGDLLDHLLDAELTFGFSLPPTRDNEWAFELEDWLVENGTKPERAAQIAWGLLGAKLKRPVLPPPDDGVPANPNSG